MDKPVEHAPSLAQGSGIPPLVMWLVCGYLLIMPIADAALYAALHRSVEITHDRSRFAVINAITLTGFQASPAVGGYPEVGKEVVLILTLAGTLFTMIVGGMAVVRIIRLPYTDQQVVWSALGVCGLFTTVGAIPLIEGGYSPFDAVMLAASALGNSGLAFGALPDMLGWQTQLVLLPLSVLGGLGLPVLMELSDVIRFRRRLSAHSRTVLAVTVGLYLAITLVCFVVQVFSAGADAETARIAGSSSVAAINSRTAGLGFQFAQSFPRGMQWILLLAMMIGGSPAGTAGGLKTTTVVELFRGVRKALAGVNPGRPFGIAATWLGAYVLMLGVMFILLLGAVPQLGADRLLFEAISALSNVGLSHGTIMMVGPGLDVLSASMLLGRLVPLGILWWMALTTQDAELAVG